MEILPDLPKLQILSYLNVQDLLACSCVSISWRAAVNNNSVWKNICFRTSNKVTIDYLQNIHSLVEQHYEDQDILNSGLEPLCYWRETYMKLMHVKFNWLKANHETYSVTNMAYNVFDIKIHNNLLVANVNDNQCEVWNIKGVPRKEETIVCALKNTRCKCMIHLSDNRLVIVQDSLLQVYSKTGKRFNMCFRRLFNQPESVSTGIPGSLTIDKWYSDHVQLRPTHLQAYHVGKFFIGVAENGSYKNSSFHIWDTFTGSKLREELVKDICPEIKEEVANVRFYPSKSNLNKILVCVYHAKGTEVSNIDRDHFTVVYVYDLEYYVFKKLQVLKPHVPWIYYEESVFITLDKTLSKLSIFKTSNGEKIVCKRYEEIINPDTVQVNGNYLGFTTGKDLVVLDIKNFELVFTTAIFKVSSSLFGFDFVFLDWDLILVGRWDEVNKIEVWSIKKKTLQNTLKTNGLIFPCDNKAKVFIWNEMVTTIFMLQFW